VSYFLEHIWQIILMVVLLCLSGFFSGSETAFFNISKRQAESIRKSGHRFGCLVAELLSSPKQLLTSLLFGNMCVNVLYFSAASVFSMGLGTKMGAIWGVVSTVVAFAVLVLFGEMMPKSLAYSMPGKFCIMAAPVCFVCMRILGPLLKFFEYVIVTPTVRLFAGAGKRGKVSQTVTAAQLKSLILTTQHEGPVGTDENRLFAEVVELGLLKTRHVMEPRVDMATCSIAESSRKITRLMMDKALTKIAVYAGRIDNIVGSVSLRDMLLRPGHPVKKLVRKVNFVPEQKSVESLLEFFRESLTDMAIVVDEYGGIAGCVRLEDIAEELLGPLEAQAEAEPVQQTGPLEYRLTANLPIHDWAATFGIDPGQTRLATVGGLVTALLGRIPKPGDVAYLKNLKFTVEEVKRTGYRRSY